MCGSKPQASARSPTFPFHRAGYPSIVIPPGTPIRHFRILRTVFLIATMAVAIPTIAAEPPAFLDRRDTIVAWSKVPVNPAQVRAIVRVDGKPVPVAKVEALPGIPDPDAYSLAGTFQESLGGSAWNPADPRTTMVPVGPGRYAWSGRLPGGVFAFKVVQGGGWGRNWGDGWRKDGPNIERTVPAGGAWVRFEIEPAKNRLRTSVDPVDPLPIPAGPVIPPPGSGTARALAIRLKTPVSENSLSKAWTLRLGSGAPRVVHPRDVLDDPTFRPRIAGRLGAQWNRSKTSFSTWSPIARNVDLLLWRSRSQPSASVVPMRRGNGGVWKVDVPGDLNGSRYQFRYTRARDTVVAADLWCTAATADSTRSVVLDLSRTNPAGWAKAPQPRLARPGDAVVYELHVRDFTVDPSSGVPASLRGKYRGLVHAGARRPDGNPAGIEHLKRLGVSHVQILPFQNFNPDHSRSYNWGYETTLFDVPEEQYAANPDDPAGVIRDTKAMVDGLHRAGIGVVLDVVYNHTVPAEGDRSPFWASVPFYWFRTDLQGRVLNESGVGNALADDRWMARHWMLQSLRYWLDEYRIDGFRFDLMGMFTPETVRAVAETLRRRRPDVLIYGEPWTGGGPVRLGIGQQKGLGVGVFNDRFRGVFRGDLDSGGRGFATGNGDVSGVRAALGVFPALFSQPSESVNYVSAHDNLTLRDKISKSLPDSPRDADRRAFRLASAAVLLAPGIAFLEGGAEIGRTKGGNPNSYNAGDTVNRFDWAGAARFDDDSEWVRALVGLRRSHPALRLPDRATMDRHQTFLPEGQLPKSTVAMRLRGVPGETWNDILVVFHGGTVSQRMVLPPGNWRIVADSQTVREDGPPVAGGELGLPPLTVWILRRD